jgi:elongation factor G
MNKGVQLVLDAVVDLLPSPLDVKGGVIVGTDVDDLKKKSFSNKIQMNLLVLSHSRSWLIHLLDVLLSFVCMLELSSQVLMYSTLFWRKERIGRLLQMHANNRTEIDEIPAGNIGAVIGLKDTKTGDTLCDENHPIVLERMVFPEPVISISVEPKTKADQEKMGMALNKLAEEDPSFRVSTNPETGQTIMAGMGELHLEILVDRMKREFKVEANVGAPQVAYRETITQEVADERGVHKKQSGGRGQFGDVVITFEPITPEMRASWSRRTLKDENVFVKQDCRRSGSSWIIPGVEKGLNHCLYSWYHRWISYRWCEGNSYIRFLPWCGLQWTRVPYGCYQGIPPGSKEGSSSSSRTDHACGSKYSRRIYGWCSRKSELKAWSDHRDDWTRYWQRSSVLMFLSLKCSDTRQISALSSQGRATYVMEFAHYAHTPNNITEKIRAERGVKFEEDDEE